MAKIGSFDAVEHPEENKLSKKEESPSIPTEYDKKKLDTSQSIYLPDGEKKQAGKGTDKPKVKHEEKASKLMDRNGSDSLRPKVDTSPLSDAEKAEWDQLYKNDYGAVNGKVMDYSVPEYLKTGKLKPKWGKDAVGDTKNTTLPEGTRIVQYAHPNNTGSYFAPEGTEYDALQLPDSKDKRIQNTYEVQKGGLDVEKSEVAKQPWNKEGDNSQGTGAVQYKSPENASTLVDQGKLKLVAKKG